MTNLKLYIELLKPLKIEKKNNIYIFYTLDGDYILKNSSCDYKKLYSYLKSRGFSSFPSLIDSTRDNSYLFNYEEDFLIDKNQKIKDILNTVSLLHSKTSYYKDVTNSIYSNIYEDIINNIEYLNIKYNSYYDIQINNPYYEPSKYVFLKNFTLFNSSLSESKKYIDKWYDNVKSCSKERVCLIHNNLRLDHYIKNENDYLISWDKYKFDTPVLDIYKFYKSSFLDGNFINNIDIYLEKYDWDEKERLLFCSLIMIPLDFSFETKESYLCKDIRNCIIYLNKSLELCSKMAIKV